MLDKKGILYMSLPEEIHAIQLEDLAVDGPSQSTSINSDMQSNSTDAQDIHLDDGRARKGFIK